MFSGCSSLTSVTIPDSVTSIRHYTFSDCSSLASVTFENPNGWWYASDDTAANGTNISDSDLSDPAVAAKYLTDTHLMYYWKKS